MVISRIAIWVLPFEGVVLTASAMIAFAAAVREEDAKNMIHTGVLALVGGASIAAIKELISEVSDQEISVPDEVMLKKWLRYLIVALVSGTLFAIGAAVPLLAAAITVKYCRHLRMVAVVSAASLGLLVFGGLGGRFPVGREPQQPRVMMKYALKYLIGGWIAISIAYFSAYNINKAP